jgi:hypothetical protein
VKKSFSIQKLLHHKSEHHETKPMQPSSLKAFQRYQEDDLKQPGLVDLMVTKQNKLPCFLDDRFELGYIVWIVYLKI